MSDDSFLTAGYDRRRFLGYFSAVGLGGTLLPGVLWAKVAGGEEITPATIACAEEISGLKFTDAQRQQMVDGLKSQETQIQQLRTIALDNAVAPAVHFDPVPPGVTLRLPAKRAMVRSRVPARTMPRELDELAFLPVTELSELVRRRKVTATQLTEMYLARITRYDPALKAVITVTRERALRQAREADAEIARGTYRGPLHGIPWGAKDLLAVKGYKTTWGAGPYREQTIDADAAVVQRLDAAGAILIAKLTLGELAQGDIWFGGTTKNPWNLSQGSSGSSAGPGSAVAAGLVGFAIGTETLGSISSPATRNGVTGLRPTFGRVPRTGAMALSWTMDKIGPMARSVEDCALVLEAIHGPDNFDRAVKNIPFSWDASLKPSSLRIGYNKAAFDLAERNDKNEVQHGTKRFDDAALAVFRTMGVTLVPVELPEMPYGAMRLVLTAEGAAAFDELTRSGRDAELVQQTPRDWANTFRTARFIAAVDYVNANRARTLAMLKWHALFETVDVIVTPTNVGSQLTATNLTGHPAVILPSGFRDTSETDRTQVPVSLTFLGGLYQEAALLAVAKAWQDATDFHLKYPVVKVIDEQR
ncbi:MAG: amidase [Gemmatimonadaceae bacterium]|nr:amidase [Gemmatimonadaceae bacterium]